LILHHLSAPRIMRPQPGNRQFIAPLAAYRRPAIMPKQSPENSK
jgi:hypothetical protein